MKSSCATASAAPARAGNCARSSSVRPERIFQISRASGSGGNGIEIPATSHRAAVRNGSLKGFLYGIRSVLAGTYAKGCAFRDLAVSGCTSYGILAGDGAVLEACRAHGNSGFAGIYAHTGTTTDCIEASLCWKGNLQGTCDTVTLYETACQGEGVHT